MNHSSTPLQDNDPYEDLLGLWSDLEAALSVLLSGPLQISDFPGKLHQLDLWLQDLITQNSDAALYLMFQRAASSTVGYSASHALVCASLCDVLARELRLEETERRVLVRAALTMNIGMNALQDQLAEQREPLSNHQAEAVKRHAQDSRELLQRLMIDDALWLEVVEQHHAAKSPMPLAMLSPAQRLVRILGAVDRYAAMISPRKTRAGRSATESLQMLQQNQQYADEVKAALVRVVGLYPPGTYVQLANGEIAVVLRRGTAPEQPEVASVIDQSGHSLFPPVLHQPGRSPLLVSALARSALSLELDPRAMAQLGMHCAMHNQALYRMVQVPGTQRLA
ncbi:phosphodiesterase [Comamonas aquatilis]|uniref:HD-GYP domain-containing protein n=1 Tax=Comamonas aquatilis TaxID=1778406 RepID=UPI0039EEDA1E